MTATTVVQLESRELSWVLKH